MGDTLNACYSIYEGGKWGEMGKLKKGEDVEEKTRENVFLIYLRFFVCMRVCVCDFSTCNVREQTSNVHS